MITGIIRHGKLIAVTIFVCVFASMVNSSPGGRGSFGLLLMAGGRYDDMRMCVASPAGVKGGPIADIMLTGNLGLNDKLGIVLNLPVMRPILFGAAFKMLQFEPELQIDVRTSISDRLLFIVAPSAGVSLHYGPDYQSELKNPTPSFFAAGPIVGCHFYIGMRDGAGNLKNAFGIKPFYAALFADGRTTGTVVGGVLEYRRSF